MDAPRQTMPAGAPVDLDGRGRTWVYDSGPPARPRPTVLLLHGWTSSAAMNWFRCFAPLAERYRVVALDHRGHGRGIRSRRPFSLEDCADDAAALAETLATGPVIAVGYSMGGPVALQLWRRYPESVAGLVLCATAARFAVRSELARPIGAVTYGMSLALAGVPSRVRTEALRFVIRRRGYAAGVAQWAVEEWERHDPAALIQAGLAIGRFDAREWLASIDVPTAVVVTTTDTTVAPRGQWELAQRIPRAMAFPVAADHRACVDEAPTFVPALLAACGAVEDASRPRAGATPPRPGRQR